MNWTAVGAIAPAVAVVVTLTIFVFESRRRRTDDRARLKREAISRLLDSMESSIRKNQGLLASLRFWENPDVTYALAIPRLIHDLGSENQVVSAWAMSQVQTMTAATSDKKAATIGNAMSMKIVAWCQGAVPNEWFANELREHPVKQDFKVKRSARIERGWHRLLTTSVSELALFTIMATSIQIVRQLPEVASTTKGLIGELIRRFRTRVSAP